MQWRAGTVVEEVRAAGRAPWSTSWRSTGAADAPVRALAYTAMVGEPRGRASGSSSTPRPCCRGLGTGGLAFVVARPDRLPADPPAAPGHIVKARYTPHAADAPGGGRAGQPAPRPCSRTPTTSGGCRWSSPTCTPRSRRWSPASGSSPRRPGRLRHDRRRGTARGLLPRRSPRSRTPDGWPATVTVGQAFGGRARGGDDRTPGCWPRGTSSAPTSPSSSRVRATSAPAPRGGTPEWPAPRRCTRPTCSVAARSRRCASRGPTVASGTVASATTAARPTAGHCLTPADVPVTALDRPGAGLLVRAQLAELVGTARAVLTVVEVPGTACSTSSADVAGGPRRWAGDWRRTPPRSLAAAPPVRHAAVAQRTSMRSTTKMSVSPGGIAPPAPRSP